MFNNAVNVSSWKAGDFSIPIGKLVKIVPDWRRVNERDATLDQPPSLADGRANFTLVVAFHLFRAVLLGVRSAGNQSRLRTIIGSERAGTGATLVARRYRRMPFRRVIAGRREPDNLLAQLPDRPTAT